MSETARSCGSCTLCCKLLGVHALDKPPYQWCTHCVTGAGCAIYAKRPFDCRTFHCMYVEEGSHVPDHWLPSRSGMILCSDPEGPRIEVHVDDVCPDAWREEPYYSDLKRWSINAVVNGGYVMVYPHGRTVVMLPYKHVDFGALDDDTQIVYVERMTPTGPVPDVELVTRDDPRFVVD